MTIKLIPVIEISAYGSSEIPASGPYWEYPVEWDRYRQINNKQAGYSENLKSYSKGSSLYKIADISDQDLLVRIKQEIDIQQTEEGKGSEDIVCPFDGGYILQVDNKDIYYPQCCGDLGDIVEWENLLEGDPDSFWAGHPYPHITVTDNNILFDFINIAIKESFVPPVPVNDIEIHKADLKNAIQTAKEELAIFAGRLKNINETENLHIDKIDIRLIYGLE